MVLSRESFSRLLRERPSISSMPYCSLLISRFWSSIQFLTFFPHCLSFPLSDSFSFIIWLFLVPLPFSLQSFLFQSLTSFWFPGSVAVFPCFLCFCLENPAFSSLSVCFFLSLNYSQSLLPIPGGILCLPSWAYCCLSNLHIPFFFLHPGYPIPAAPRLESIKGTFLAPFFEIVFSTIWWHAKK